MWSIIVRFCVWRFLNIAITLGRELIDIGRVTNRRKSRPNYQ